MTEIMLSILKHSQEVLSYLHLSFFYDAYSGLLIPYPCWRDTFVNLYRCFHIFSVVFIILEVEAISKHLRPIPATNIHPSSIGPIQALPPGFAVIGPSKLDIRPPGDRPMPPGTFVRPTGFDVKPSGDGQMPFRNIA